MGSRANLILVNEMGYRVYYCHWCAQTIPEDVFWGPDDVLPYIMRQQYFSGDDGWLDNVYANGGLLLDILNRHMLLFGGEDIQYDIPYRRLYMSLLKQVWAGWHVRWAYDGLFELANYVGYPLAKIRNPKLDVEFQWAKLKLATLWSEAASSTRTYHDGLNSVRHLHGEVRIFPQNSGEDNLEVLLFGPSILETLNLYDGLTSFAPPLDEPSLPSNGFHIDLTKQELYFWSNDASGLYELLVPAWPNWTVIWLQDRYEDHFALTDGAIKFPPRDTDKLLQELRTLLLKPMRDFDPGKLLAVALSDKPENAASVEVNPNFLVYNPQVVPQRTRQEIFDKAVESWRQSNRS